MISVWKGKYLFLTQQVERFYFNICFRERQKNTEKQQWILQSTQMQLGIPMGEHSEQVGGQSDFLLLVSGTS